MYGICTYVSVCKKYKSIRNQCMHVCSIFYIHGCILFAAESESVSSSRYVVRTIRMVIEAHVICILQAVEHIYTAAHFTYIGCDVIVCVWFTEDFKLDQL